MLMLMLLRIWISNPTPYQARRPPLGNTRFTLKHNINVATIADNIAAAVVANGSHAASVVVDDIALIHQKRQLYCIKLLVFLLNLYRRYCVEF
jgi:hypothetical protein